MLFSLHIFKPLMRLNFKAANLSDSRSPCKREIAYLALANRLFRPYSAALAAGIIRGFTIAMLRYNEITLVRDNSLRMRICFGADITKRGAVYYETIFIVNPDVSKENTEALTDALVKRVEKASGRIVKREYWGSRPLAYQIAKRRRGHYVMLVTDGEHAAVQALEESLRLEERVLRLLTTRLRELSDEPSPLLRRQIKSAESAKNEDKPAEGGVTEEAVAKEKIAAAVEDSRDEDSPVADAAEKPVKEGAAGEEAGDGAVV